MTNSRTTWDLQRFWRTLDYYDSIPLWSCVQKLFGTREERKVHLPMKSILAIGATGDLARETLPRLTDRNCRVLAIVADIDAARRLLGEKVDLVTIRSPEILAGIDRVIVFADGQDIEESLNWLKNADIPGEKTLFDFSRPAADIRETWGAIDDVVMGGMSESGIRLVNGRAIFTGNVSIDNNGGFASVRTRDFSSPLDLSAYEGFRLRVIGDGKRYKFIARCEDRWDGVGYCYSFDTIDRQEVTIEVPFTELVPVVRARSIRDGRSFDRERVYSLQLMQSKFEYDGALNPRFSPGLFQLEINSIGVYGGRANAPEIIVVAKDGEPRPEFLGNYPIVSPDRVGEWGV